MEYHLEFDMKGEEIGKILSEAAAIEVLLAKKSASWFMQKDENEMEKELEAIIGLDAVCILKEAFRAETYTMTLRTHTDGLDADLSKNGKNYTNSIAMSNNSSGMSAIWYLLNSILIEIIWLLLRLVGVRANVDDMDEMHRMESGLGPIVRTNAVQQALSVFVTDWYRGDADIWRRARAIFNLIRDSHIMGILWPLLNFVMSQMGIVDCLLVTAKVVATLVHALITDGSSLIPRICVALHHGANFFHKVHVLAQLTAREREYINAMLRSLGLPEI